MSKAEDAYMAALSAFNHHVTGCQCCDRFTGNPSELSLLCLKGWNLWTTQDALAIPAATLEDRRRHREAMKAEAKRQKLMAREMRT